MVECDFCGDEFDSERALHLHWGEEHEEELNSHQEEKVKKAERKAEEEKEKKMEERKRYAFYGLAAILGIGAAALILPQLLPSGTSGTAELDLSEEPMLGSENASVTVVEFGDYRCPYCRRFEQSTFPRLKDEYIDTGEIKFYYVNYAFLGPGSQDAAVAAECFYRQDEEQFWDYHKAIYENQGSEGQEWVTEDLLMEVARNSTEGLDYTELEQCISGEETMPEVLEDRNMGERNGIDSTPSVLVNGQMVRGNSFSDIEPVIERALSRQ